MLNKIFFRESLKIQLVGWPIYWILMLLINSKLNPNVSIYNVGIAWCVLFIAFNVCAIILYVIVSKKTLWMAILMVIALYILLSEAQNLFGLRVTEIKEGLFSSSRERYYWTVFNNYVGLWFMVAGLVFNCKAKENYRMRMREMELRFHKEKEAQEMKFAFYTLQLNPHFLYNVLSGIKSKVESMSSPLAKQIEQLTDLLKYLLSQSDAGKKKVLLVKELEALNNYLALEKQRYKGVEVDYVVEGIPEGQKVVPAALITIVENAFKYGVYNCADDPIRIKLILSHDWVIFEYFNKINLSRKGGMSLGTGHKNLIARLQMAFPDAYAFECRASNEQYYYVRLQINQS